jgi:endonuclease/exonuclease/phosphatase family metal-dependent hydrolase
MPASCRFLLILLLFAGCRATPRDAAPGALRIRVLTYNVLGGRNTDGARDLERLAAVIEALEPDVVALQEVDRGTGRLDGVDLPAELERLTGLRHAFGRAMYYDGGEYGEAILSRFPILDVTNHALPHREGSEPRAALAATLQLPGTDQTFVFIGTHLDHQRDPADRVAQAHALNDLLDRYAGRPLILAGDLNAVPESEPMQILRAEWTDAWPDDAEGLSFPSDAPDRRIDYVLYRPSERWRVENTYRGLDVNRSDTAWRALLNLASDHLPVVAEMTLHPAP